MVSERKLVRFKAPLYLKISLDGSPQEVSAVAKDISMGGIKVVVDKSLVIAAENELSLFLFFPQRTLSVSGKVIWVKRYDDRKEAGICFVNIPEGYKEDICNYIFKYYPKEVAKKWWQM